MKEDVKTFELEDLEDLQTLMVKLLDSDSFEWTDDIKAMPEGHDQIKECLDVIKSLVKIISVVIVVTDENDEDRLIALTMIRGLLSRYGCMIAKLGDYLAKTDAFKEVN